MPVVTISRQFGAGGSSVAEIVAKKTGAEVLDRALIDEIAARLAMPPAEVEQEAERPRTLLENLVRSFASFEPSMGAGWSPPYPDPLFDPRREIIALTEQLIRESAATGNVVIVGRGAGFILRDQPDVLRVFLRAPVEARLKVVMERSGLEEDEARRRIHETDSNRAAYIRQLYGQHWEDPEEYDLVINTGRTGLEGAAVIVLQALRIPAGRAPAKP